MTHVFDIDPGRATRDVDFAIALWDWPQYETFKKAFTDTGNFIEGTNDAHRLYYRPDIHGIAYPLDLIPFGQIAGNGNTIAWPPDMAVVMNVTGFADALKNALRVDMGDDLIVNVVSIPSLAVLKLIAWDDRGLRDSKDAQDLLFCVFRST